MAQNRKYEVDLKLLTRLSKLALTQEEIAAALNIPLSTFKMYLREDKSIRAAWEIGKAKPTREVEKALYKRAVGFEYKEVDETFKRVPISDQPDAPLEERLIERKVKTRRALPDTAAIAIWLKAHKPEKYMDHFKITMTLKDRMKRGAGG